MNISRYLHFRCWRTRKPPPAGPNHAQTIHDSRNVSVAGNMNTVAYTNTVVSGGANNFMEKLLEKTIPGAAFNSSARDPPPRCHPGTRLAILEQCLHFIVNCRDNKMIRWVVGAAGVGKSAIMQSVAESGIPSVIWRASIFFVVNGRSDGKKAIVTLAFQLAAQCQPYHQFIEREIIRDPSLLYSSMSVQFNKFIVEPFIDHPRLNSAGRVLIIIDGLDECHNSHSQRDLLQLITDLCLTYPSSPIVWMVASRPEPHITSFFAQASVKAAYVKEEILVDSDEAREDVERFLRNELTKIQDEFSLHPRTQWPSEQDFWKIAKASGGLFIYAHATIKYIGDRDIGDPIEQLNDVLRVIDAHSLPDLPREKHPMAQLYALYSRILSKVPVKVMENARKLLLALVAGWEDDINSEGKTFIVLCNWLGITCDEAYAALRHLNSVLHVPGRDTAHKDQLRYFHKSFIDYISDFGRSKFLYRIKHEAHQLYVQCTFRILEQAPDGIDAGNLDYNIVSEFLLGTLLRGPGTSGNISLAWPVDEESDWDDNKTRLYMYKMAVLNVARAIRFEQQAFCTPFCVRFLATRFQSLREPGIQNLHQVVFDKSRRHEFEEQGLLQQIPVGVLNFPDIKWKACLQFCRPRIPESSTPDPWNPSCKHQRQGKWGQGNDQAWSTQFFIPSYTGDECSSCSQRLEHQLTSWITRFPDYLVSVLFTSAGRGLVEFQFADPEDCMSEWTYWLWHQFSEKE